jgi:hypothetical protein
MSTVPPPVPSPRFPNLRPLLAQFAAFALAFLAARYGIPVPPPVIPPGAIPAPIINLPPPEFPLPEKQKPGAVPNPAAAICRLSFTGVGCTATVIGPRRPDGRWWVMTASHCTKAVGQHGTIRFLDGRVTGVVVASRNPTPDVAWLVTEANSEDFPFALLAVSSPPVGTAIWHAGYGVDTPGNREVGEITALPDSNGQLRFTLSVSSGDSGGAIVSNERGEVVSCVCCTSARGKKAATWGTSPEAALRARPTEMVMDDWQPIEVPLRKGG